ncbi:MAG: glycosyltransferase family 39 protein [Anaerolineales bacterium]|nr:glycosyltransferase family 39 protein [Anaerolineales bacterium]
MSPRRTTQPRRSLLDPSSRTARILLAVILLLGFGLRMLDLTDPPLDFHATRQLHGAIVARSIYFEMNPDPDPATQERMVTMRNVVGELEPPILETIVAFGYRLAGGPEPWVARVINSLAWMLAGIPLYGLARRFGGRLPALLAVAYYSFLPFAAQASRSFQPDPLMVALLIFGAYAAYRWSETREWKWALWAAAASGLAVLVKIVAVYIVVGYMVALVLATLGFKPALRNRQVWAMAALSALPAVTYYLLNIGQTSGSYLQDWILALLPQAFVPSFYIFWVKMLDNLFSSGALVAAGLGTLLAPPGRPRSLLVGIWLGYVLYGISLPHQTTTHSYYHLQLVPLIALGLVSMLDILREKLQPQARVWQALALAVALGIMVHSAWIFRSVLFSANYRGAPAYWAEVGEAIPNDGNTIGLVDGYGYLLNYYGGWNLHLWPITAEFNLAEMRGSDWGSFEEYFEDRTADVQYFLITELAELERQKELKAYLEANAKVYTRGDGFIIYDLGAK